MSFVSAPPAGCCLQPGPLKWDGDSIRKICVFIPIENKELIFFFFFLLFFSPCKFWHLKLMKKVRKNVNQTTPSRLFHPFWQIVVCEVALFVCFFFKLFSYVFIYDHWHLWSCSSWELDAEWIAASSRICPSQHPSTSCFPPLCIPPPACGRLTQRVWSLIMEFSHAAYC